MPMTMSFVHITNIIMTIFSVWTMILLVYQIVIGFFGYGKKKNSYEPHDPKLKYLILVPAHNEEKVIGDIIRNLQSMDYPKELYDFYILADNCTDNTAGIAAELGANVLESHKEGPDAPTGKPIALQKALEALPDYADKYDLVMFFDADNLMDTGMLREVNSQFLSMNDNVQVVQCYLGCKNRKGLVALFYYMSYTITNRFFQLAKSRLGLNCVIGGTGFAIRSGYLKQRGGWTSMSLTEDFEMQIQATCEGKQIAWNHNVRIYDEKPTRFKASFRQRVRWAQGHWFVTFRNTKSLFQALFHKTISFSEFVSTFFYMYSLTPFVILFIQLLIGIIELILMLTGAIPMELEIPTFSAWISSNWFSLLLFFYSFFLLFFIAEWQDNQIKTRLIDVPVMLLSLLMNTFVAGFAQVVGLVLHRRQNHWVKTEHNIQQNQQEMLKNLKKL